MDVNHMTIQMPHQLFINGEFVDSSNGCTFDTINPTDGSVSIWHIQHDISLLSTMKLSLQYLLIVELDYQSQALIVWMIDNAIQWINQVDTVQYILIKKYLLDSDLSVG